MSERVQGLQTHSVSSIHEMKPNISVVVHENETQLGDARNMSPEGI